MIRVAYAGVNPSDSKTRAGVNRRADVTFPFVTGMDAAAVVERTGRNVTEFRGGDRVLTWGVPHKRAWGTYAEFVRVPARNLAPMPKRLTFAQAAGVPVASLTAFQSLFQSENGDILPGQKVLIHGAAGGVGSFAVQFAKSGGLLVAGSCGTSNVSYVKSLGAGRVIDYKNEDVCQAIREWSAEGVDVVLDTVGPATLPQALDMLRPGGRLISVLTATAYGDIEGDRKDGERRGLWKVMMIIDLERARDSMQEITDLIDGGLVHVPPISVVRLEDAARAHQISTAATSGENWSSRFPILRLMGTG